MKGEEESQQEANIPTMVFVIRKLPICKPDTPLSLSIHAQDQVTDQEGATRESDRMAHNSGETDITTKLFK